MAKSITVTCPNPDIMAELEKLIKKTLHVFSTSGRDVHKRRGASLATISNEHAKDDIMAALANGIEAADAVVANWSNCSLAEAVNQLEAWADANRNLLRA